MIMYLSDWVSSNAKALAIAGSLLGGVGGAGVGLHEYIVAVDHRLDTIEHKADLRQTQLDKIEQDVRIVRCMTVLTAEGADPLECLNY